MKGYIRWLMSATVRHAVDMRKQVEKFLNQQRDLLSAESIAMIQVAVDELKAALKEHADKKTLEGCMKKLEEVANKKLIPYPNASIRENIDVILVAVAVALGIRTFFLQPFKIPTGSMQPTLYGITSVNLRDNPEEDIPGRVQRFIDTCFNGISYYHVTAPEDCVIESASSQIHSNLIFNKWQEIGIVTASGERKTLKVRFPTDNLFDYKRGHIRPGQRFAAGDDILKLKVVKGDHLFVDRFTYNFRRPERGEIIVFKTAGIEGLDQTLFYIKRLVGLGGERMRIGNDQHVRINGERLDAATPRFEHVYTFSDEWSDVGHVHFGHVNGTVSLALRRQNLSPIFFDDNSEFAIGENRYVVLGDNTMNSLDSRQWGDFPRENVIGKSAFVYWPFNKRFGWSHR